MVPAPRPVSLQVRADIEQLLAYEAYLLDEKRLHDWLQLFTPDIRYAVYVREKVQFPGRAAERTPAPAQLLFEDDRAFLELRVKRLDTGMAHAEKPPSLTRHFVSNLLVSAEGDGVSVRTNLHIYQVRMEGDECSFYGKREDRLRLTEAAGALHAVRSSSITPPFRVP